MKRTEKDLHISSFRLNFAVKCKKTAHKCCNFQKLCLYLCRRLEKGDDIEESTRQRICKIRSIRVKSLKAASPAVAYILLSPVWSWLAYIPAGVS